MSKEPKRNVYVGHRYVPKIMGEWNKEQSYEGLSIVTHQGTSYTSKKHVPVGVDISNEEYWVVTGNYNAQVENYRQEVKQMENRVNTKMDNTISYVEENLQEVKEDVDHNQKRIIDFSVNVKDFGAVGDGIEDDTLAIQNAIDSVGTRGSVYFPKGIYRTTIPLRFPANAKGIKLFSNQNAQIKADHNGDLIIMHFEDSNSGYNIIEGLRLTGPNKEYPDVNYIPPSTGAGIKMKNSYYNVIRDCYISGFDVGIYMQNAIKTRVEGKTYIRFNQIGVLMDGYATNSNNFVGISIRENRKRGILIRKNPESNYYPTHNNFDSCLIESNTPYPYDTNNAPENSVGIELDGVYDNKFSNCYSENHEIAILIKGSSDENMFTGHRFNRSSDGRRLEEIVFEGPGIANNIFRQCVNTTPMDVINVRVDNTEDARGNLFVDCSGFKFDNFHKSGFEFINLRKSKTFHGDRFGALYIPNYGRRTNVTEGTSEAEIEGIGTDNAVLNAKGFGEIVLTTGITADTTITDITGLRKGQIFILTNYQENHKVHIKSSTTGTSGIVLKDLVDVTLDKYSQTLVFYVNNIGTIVEIGRNIRDFTENRGIDNLPSNESSVTIEHGLSKKPTIVNVTPVANIGSVWITDINDTSFTVNCSNPRIGNTGIHWYAKI